MKNSLISFFFLIPIICFAPITGNALAESLHDHLMKESLQEHYNSMNQDLGLIDQSSSNNSEKIFKKIDLADRWIEAIKRTYSQSDADKKAISDLLNFQKKYHNNFKLRSCYSCCISYHLNPIVNQYVDKTSYIMVSRLEILGR